MPKQGTCAYPGGAGILASHGAAERCRRMVLKCRSLLGAGPRGPCHVMPPMLGAKHALQGLTCVAVRARRRTARTMCAGRPAPEHDNGKALVGVKGPHGEGGGTGWWGKQRPWGGGESTYINRPP